MIKHRLHVVGPVQEHTVQLTPSKNLEFVNIMIQTFPVAERLAWGREFYMKENPSA